MRCIKWRQTVICAATMVSMMLVACSSANQASIYRRTNLEDRNSVVTDAKQRIVTNVPAEGGPGGNKPTRIVCAEPSPDVAQAISEAISASLKADTGGAVGGGRGDGGQGAFSKNLAEAMAQLGEQLATIQLLRDGLYRACEMYANGAINETTYAVIASRYDDTMITMLLGELAAGAFGHSGAAVGTAADEAPQAERLPGANSPPSIDYAEQYRHLPYIGAID